MIEQLGLEPHDPVETLKDTVNSLMMWGLIQPRKGEDNYNWCEKALFGPCGLVSAMSDHLCTGKATVSRDSQGT